MRQGGTEAAYLFLVDQSHLGHVYVKVVNVWQADFHILYLESTTKCITLSNNKFFCHFLYLIPPIYYPITQLCVEGTLWCSYILQYCSFLCLLLWDVGFLFDKQKFFESEIGDLFGIQLTGRYWLINILNSSSFHSFFCRSVLNTYKSWNKTLIGDPSARLIKTLKL